MDTQMIWRIRSKLVGRLWLRVLVAQGDWFDWGEWGIKQAGGAG